MDLFLALVMAKLFCVVILLQIDNQLLFLELHITIFVSASCGKID